MVLVKVRFKDKYFKKNSEMISKVLISHQNQEVHQNQNFSNLEKNNKKLYNMKD